MFASPEFIITLLYTQLTAVNALTSNYLGIIKSRLLVGMAREPSIYNSRRGIRYLWVVVMFPNLRMGKVKNGISNFLTEPLSGNPKLINIVYIRWQTKWQPLLLIGWSELKQAMMSLQGMADESLFLINSYTFFRFFMIISYYCMLSLQYKTIIYWNRG